MFLEHLRSRKEVSFKEEIVNEQKVTIVSVVVQNPEVWKLPHALEARGIVFDQDGKVICRPFEKFFNAGEREETLLHNLDFRNSIILEKRDGSLITPVLIGGKVFFKSKKSFYSKEAKLAAESASEQVLALSYYLCSKGITPIFEFTHPETKLVVNYGDKPKFVILAARYNDSGEYVTFDELERIAEEFDVQLIQKFDLTIEEVKKNIETLTNFEGYVIILQNGKRVKWKTNWYLKNHRAKNNQLRVRDIAALVADEEIDDVKSFLSLEGFDLQPILEIEKKVLSEIAEIRYEVEKHASEIQGLSVKDVVERFKGHSLFPLIIAQYKGKKVDYAEYWKKNRLGSYSLKVVY